MPEVHPRYTAEFKADAVALVRSSGKSIPLHQEPYTARAWLAT